MEEKQEAVIGIIKGGLRWRVGLLHTGGGGGGGKGGGEDENDG